ncbi:MAG TPA: APC family permease [Gemmatimonadaceae bacterium]|nr:APC family permease [Gemmatimonadaceae bacterium]
MSQPTELRRELGLADLVLMQVVFVVGSGWVGTAAKLGPSHLVFWLLAIALYYLPQAAVVIHLNRRMPLEGGLYQWAKAAFGEFAGFLVAWNLWVFAIVIMASFYVMVARNIAYLLGTSAGAFADTPWYNATVSIVVAVMLVAVAIRGLGLGKWFSGFGGVAQILTYIALIAIPIVALSRGTISSYRPFATEVPEVSLLSLNIFGKMALGAMSGFEFVALMAGEAKRPERTIPQSVVIATPLIALMFILGTSTVLAFVPRDQIDLVSPIPQTLQAGVQGLGVAAYIAPVLILLLLLRQLGALNMIFAGNTRLPMVAGWDGLLPAWFTRLHPKSRTPVNSIMVVGAITLALALASFIGTETQEAFQLLENVGGILYAMAFVALFAIPLFGARRLGWKPPLWLRIASASGLAVTVLYSVLSIFPIIDVPSWQIFAVKVGGTVVGTNLLGAVIYAVARRRGSIVRASVPEQA